MRVEMLTLALNPNPPWILGIDEEAGQHISGELREASDQLFNTPGGLGYFSELLGEAAEKLDDAHEEWMEEQLRPHGVYVE